MKYIFSTYRVSVLRVLGAILLLSTTSSSFVSAAVSYGSITYHTVGYGASNEWSGVFADPVVAANDNDGDYSYITTTHVGKSETFTSDTPSLPSGAVLNGVSLYMFAKKVDVSDNGVTDPANDPQITFRVEDGTNPTHVSDDGVVTISNDGTYALYSRHLTKNPITGNDWTLGDLVSGGLRYGIVRTNEGSETGIEPRVTAFWIDINYSIDATTTGTSTEGSGGNGGGGNAGGSSTSTNTVPIANPQTITITPNTSATTTLTGTDLDLPAQTLTFAIGTTTTNGTTILVGNQVTYIPNTDFVGTDSFSFTVSDGVSTSTPAVVTIIVATSTSSGGLGGGSSSGGSGSSSGGLGGGGSSVTSGGGYFVGGGSGSGAGSPAGKVLGASTSCGIYMTKFTRNGYRNDVDTVKKLQSFLNSYLGVSIPVTGYFGPLTEKYVKQLQLKHKDVMLAPWSVSTPTGISYLTTVTGINNIVCPDLHLIVPTNLIPFSAHPDTPKKIK